MGNRQQQLISHPYDADNPAHEQFANNLPINTYVDVYVVGQAFNYSTFKNAKFYNLHTTESKGRLHRNSWKKEKYSCSFYINRDSEGQFFAIYAKKTDNDYEKSGSKYDIFFVDYDGGIGQLKYHFKKVTNGKVWEYLFAFYCKDVTTNTFLGTRRESTTTNISEECDGKIYEFSFKVDIKTNNLISPLPVHGIISEIPWNSCITIMRNGREYKKLYFGLVGTDTCYVSDVKSDNTTKRQKGSNYSFSIVDDKLMLERYDRDYSKKVWEFRIYLDESEHCYMLGEYREYYRGCDVPIIHSDMGVQL